MRKLLLVAAILCSSSNILSTYGGKKQKAEKCGDFEPISKACYAMQSGGAEGLCRRTWLFIFDEVCSFSCSETGQLRRANCHRCDNKEKSYPDCDDLKCERVTAEKDTNSTSEDTTTENPKYNTQKPISETTTGNYDNDAEVIND